MKKTTRNHIRIYLIVSSCILGISFFISAFLAVFSVMMFDAPHSENNWITVALATTMMAMPVLILFSIGLAWLFYSKKREKLASGIISIPYLNGLLIVVLFVLLEIYCDGSFSC